MNYTLLIFNLITVVCGVVAIWAAVMIYKITLARAAFWMIAAASYITAARLAITLGQLEGNNWITEHTSYIVFFYWPLKAFALVLLYYAIRSVLPKKADRRKTIINERYTGPERRKSNEE